jgi:hypothetical protein
LSEGDNDVLPFITIVSSAAIEAQVLESHVCCWLVGARFPGCVHVLPFVQDSRIRDVSKKGSKFEKIRENCMSRRNLALEGGSKNTTQEPALSPPGEVSQQYLSTLRNKPDAFLC